MYSNEMCSKICNKSSSPISVGVKLAWDAVGLAFYRFRDIRFESLGESIVVFRQSCEIQIAITRVFDTGNFE